MRLEDGCLVVYGNKLNRSQSQKAIKWQKMLASKFDYDPDEKYSLSLEDNSYLGEIFGLKISCGMIMESRLKTRAQW